MKILRSIAGVVVLAVWFPVLVEGLHTLRSRGRFGEADRLITSGPYARVRHPLYAGLSLTIVGVGLLVGVWPLVLGGVLWLGVTQVWAIHEERDLAGRFGEEYERYRRATPRVIPRRRSRLSTCVPSAARQVSERSSDSSHVSLAMHPPFAERLASPHDL